MKFLIITHTPHKQHDGLLYGYAPYVREMNLWLKYVDDVEIVAPLVFSPISKIEVAYTHDNIKFNSIPSIEFTSFQKVISSLFKIPVIIFTLFKACKKTDHIHLRCPGNIGLLGCLVQVFFPKKTKTAKYAGNWNPKSKQPLSYKLQKYILSNPFLTKNMQVLAYGEWGNQSKNIKPFFTASFSNEEKEIPMERNYANELRFVFVGSLVKGKNPFFAIQIIEGLKKKGKNASLDIFGDGILKTEIENYIQNNNLNGFISLKGNQDISILKDVLKTAHFLILPSKSEGWPKAVAEAMFFGTIPIVTKISCVPYMLDYGKRGILINSNLNDALFEIQSHLKNEKELKAMSNLASKWSQNYTLDTFEMEITKLLNN